MIIAPFRSLVLSVILLMREVRRSIPRSGACEKSASTKSQLSKATEEKRQSLKLPFLNRQCAKRTWFILLIARLMYPALHSCSRIWFKVVSEKLVPSNLQKINSTRYKELSAKEILDRSQFSNRTSVSWDEWNLHSLNIWFWKVQFLKLL